MQTNVIFEKIDELINSNAIVVFIKGTAEIPLCRFSAQVVTILNNLEVDFVAINVLEDEEMRQGIKDYADWPTIPQLYIKGSFVGGCDIVKEMLASFELQKLLKSKGLLSEVDS